MFPLQISVSTANCSEHRSFASKIEHLPVATKYVLADAGYDGNANAEAFEYDCDGRPNGRRFVCPLQARGAKPRVGEYPRRGRRERSRQRRARRYAFYTSRTGKCLYRRRGVTVEPFNEWFKRKFELHDRVWHLGLANNQTQIGAAMFIYQLLLRFHYRNGGQNGKIQWILDAI